MIILRVRSRGRAPAAHFHVSHRQTNAASKAGFRTRAPPIAICAVEHEHVGVIGNRRPSVRQQTSEQDFDFRGIERCRDPSIDMGVGRGDQGVDTIEIMPDQAR